MRSKVTAGITFWVLMSLFPSLSPSSAEIKPKKIIKSSPAKQKEESKSNSITILYEQIDDLYNQISLAARGLDNEVFKKALTGWYNLKQDNRISDGKEIISIIDFNLSSSKKRLWVIDLAQKKLLFHTLVAHGKGSGEEWAEKFSNNPQSYQSSLGFYLTGEIYEGKNGRSLRLDGIDSGFNTNARSRAVVIHGANYVSENFISQNGRLGRSQGCPAVPMELNDIIIDTIQNNTCLFINGNDPNYYSVYLNEDAAANYLANAIQASL